MLGVKDAHKVEYIPGIPAPRVIVAGTGSDTGKTAVAMGLMAALQRRLDVQPFKVGPDYIDPSHHTSICGRPSRNLDTYMMGEDGVLQSFSRAQRGADINIIEGVMGLYDGLDSTGEASTAHVAEVLQAPVLLVADVKGMSQSAAALVKGYREYGNLNLAGVILNRVGSDRHRDSVEEVLNGIGVPVVGALPRLEDLAIPSRHLGLHMAHESRLDKEKLAGVIDEYVDLDMVVDIARSSPPIPPPREPMIRPADVRVGVALDAAFCFYYADCLDELRRCGAQLEFFSPLAGETLDVDGVYLGGGYPELFAADLEASPTTRWLRRMAENELPIFGECGGLMYLGESLETDHTHHMCGVLPAHTRMKQRLVALGYVEGIASGMFEGWFRGHEFHYSDTDVEGDGRFSFELRRGRGIRDGLDGLTEYNTLGSYSHLHFASADPMGFLDLCRC